MFKDNLQRTIGKVLKEKGFELVEIDSTCIYYMKPYSDDLAFYVRCKKESEYESDVVVTFHFTVIGLSDHDLTNSCIGLQIPVAATAPEREINKEHTKWVVVKDEFQDEIMIIAGKKIIDIQESFGEDIAQMKSIGIV